MAALVKPSAPQKTRRSNREEMLRQQHARTPMSGKSALQTSVQSAANGSFTPFVAVKRDV
jgi:hypothetical protein